MPRGTRAGRPTRGGSATASRGLLRCAGSDDVAHARTSLRVRITLTRHFIGAGCDSVGPGVTVQGPGVSCIQGWGDMGEYETEDRNDQAGSTIDRAFAELRPAMLALAYRITGNRADAEEIVQDAFVRLHHAEPKEAVRSFKAYLTTITARLSLNRLRDQRARRETYVGE